MQFWQVHMRVQQHIVLNEVPDAQGKGRFEGSNPEPKHTIANCSHSASYSYVLPHDKYKWKTISLSVKLLCSLLLLLLLVLLTQCHRLKRVWGYLQLTRYRNYHVTLYLLTRRHHRKPKTFRFLVLWNELLSDVRRS